MSINFISGDLASLALQPLKPTVSLDQPLKGTTATNGHQLTSHAVDVNITNTDFAVKEQTSGDHTTSNDKPVRMMNHVVVEYNRHGNIRIKFMDSANYVIYQIPSEMVTKIEDQMLNLGTTATTEG